jgi:phage terminase Nu1 subunit (DNA packaging protein)
MDRQTDAIRMVIWQAQIKYWLYTRRYDYKMPEKNGQTDGRHSNGYLTSSAIAELKNAQQHWIKLLEESRKANQILLGWFHNFLQRIAQNLRNSKKTDQK